MICWFTRAAYGHGRDGMGARLAPSRFGYSRPTIYPPGLHLSILSSERIHGPEEHGRQRSNGSDLPPPDFWRQVWGRSRIDCHGYPGGSYGIADLNSPNHNLSVYEV
jgi:hypothetical protein